MINIVSREPQLFSLFGKSKFKQIEVTKEYKILILTHEGTEYQIKLYSDFDETSIHWSRKNNLGYDIANYDFFNTNQHSVFINPPENTTFILDRWQFVGVWVKLFRVYGIGFFKKLEQIYKERNCRITFGLAYFEPLDYEVDHYTACNYDYDFDYIKLADYPLFEGLKNTRVNTFNSLWSYIYDILAFEVSPNNWNKILNGEETFFDWLDGLVKPTDDRENVFAMMGGKPRYHRLYFINKVIENGLVDRGYVTMNKFFFDEYATQIKSDNPNTDGTNLLKQEVFDYWNTDFYKPLSYYDKIKDPLGEHKRFEYTTENIVNKEYNNSYIEIVAETHILFNKMFDFWSEKTYHGLFFEKLFISVGANKFYREFEKLGGHTFIKELGINPLFLETEDPLKQMDYVIECLEKLSIEDTKRIYLENLSKIQENKKIILDWIYNELDYFRQFILK
jgi:hypothetical protein